MTNPMQPMTKLDAVNQMLASIGQAPLNSLDTTGIRDAAIAELSLDTETRAILNLGWSFNTDEEWELTPDVNDNILIPANTLWVDPCDHTKNFVVRYNSDTQMFWDKDNRTFTITEPVKVNIIWAQDYEELPQVARSYIAVRAARIFQSQVIGSEVLFQFTAQHEAEAKAALDKLETRTKDTNMLRSAVDTNLIFTRRRNPSRYY
jgi:hypothetical protein